MKEHGFADVLEFLSHMKELVHVRQMGNGMYKVVPTLNRIEQWTKEENVLKPAGGRSSVQCGGSKRPMISPFLTNQLEEFIQGNPDGLKLGDFQAKFKEQYGDLNIAAYGCQSMAQFCMLLSDIFSLRKPERGVMDEWVVFPKSNATEKNVTPGSNPGTDATRLINEEIVANLRMLLIDFPEGLDILHLGEKYQVARVLICFWIKLIDFAYFSPFLELVSTSNHVDSRISKKCFSPFLSLNAKLFSIRLTGRKKQLFA